jgi:DNA-binding MarR family transcriptional regulator
MAARKAPEQNAHFYDNPMNSIGYLTRITFRSFSRNLERMTLEFGVSAGQWPFLRALWNEEGMTQRELSRRVSMREPTTVTALNGMERAGFIKRVPSKEDRRKVHIFLTAKGRRLRDKLIPCVSEVNAIAARDLDPADIATLRRVLLKMSDNLAREEATFLKSHAGVVLPMGSETP